MDDLAGRRVQVRHALTRLERHAESVGGRQRQRVVVQQVGKGAAFTPLRDDEDVWRFRARAHVQHHVRVPQRRQDGDFAFEALERFGSHRRLEQQLDGYIRSCRHWAATHEGVNRHHRLEHTGVGSVAIGGVNGDAPHSRALYTSPKLPLPMRDEISRSEARSSHVGSSGGVVAGGRGVEVWTGC